MASVRRQSTEAEAAVDDGDISRSSSGWRSTAVDGSNVRMYWQGGNGGVRGDSSSIGGNGGGGLG